MPPLWTCRPCPWRTTNSCASQRDNTRGAFNGHRSPRRPGAMVTERTAETKPLSTSSLLSATLGQTSWTGGLRFALRLATHHYGEPPERPQAYAKQLRKRRDLTRAARRGAGACNSPDVISARPRARAGMRRHAEAWPHPPRAARSLSLSPCRYAGRLSATGDRWPYPTSPANHIPHRPHWPVRDGAQRRCPCPLPPTAGARCQHAPPWHPPLPSGRRRTCRQPIAALLACEPRQHLRRATLCPSSHRTVNADKKRDHAPAQLDCV